MKLGPEMYHVNTFHLDQNEGGSELAAGRGIQNTIKRCHEINKISALTRPTNSLKKAMNVGIFLMSSLTIWLYSWREIHGVGGGRGGGKGLTPHTGGASY